MPVREFWNEDPELLWTYRKSYIDKIKIQKEIDNQNAWLHGLYINEAVSKCLYNYFARKETEQPQHYISEPFDFEKTEQDRMKEKIQERERQIREQNERIKQILKNKSR